MADSMPTPGMLANNSASGVENLSASILCCSLIVIDRDITWLTTVIIVFSVSSSDAEAIDFFAASMTFLALSSLTYGIAATDFT
jgi:hypothetical protein